MRFFKLVILLLLASNVFAATVINGYIRKGTISLPSRGRDSIVQTDPFPSKHYDAYDLLIQREPELVLLNSVIKINQNSYHLIGTKCSLDLVTYDKKTGYFKYQLSIKANKMADMNLGSSLKPISIDGSLFFTDKNLSAITIEGKVTFKNNYPEIENIKSNSDGFSLKFDNKIKDLILTAIRDVPIKIYTN